MRSCATNRATSSSIISVSAKTRRGSIIQPDCADLPYFLRAYFAFKMGLPFGYSKCTRGGGGKPPRCPQWLNIAKGRAAGDRAPQDQKAPTQRRPLRLFGRRRAARPHGRSRPQGLVPGSAIMSRTTVANGVHSGTGRTAADDNNTDYYPVPLDAETLRPGTIYADPYGHVLVLVKRVPQTSDGAGVFLAVDGQPDGTVARKRFWRGNFLFAQDPALGSPGFKRFRPIVRRQERQLAAPDQRRDRQEIPTTAITRSSSRSSASRSSTTAWTT